MAKINPPLKPVPDTIDKAQEIINKFEKCSRDHLLTYQNDTICIALAKNWKEIDAALCQVSRDMARPTGDKESWENLNAVHVATNQLISRLHAFAERGAELISK